MTRDELLARLQSIEWNDLEFKEAGWAVPKDALSTVSAFANTSGGYLVFGVKQANNNFSITGVIEADKIQNTFLGQLRDLNKISTRLEVDSHLLPQPEGTVLAFFVPEAERQQKPVYLDGSPKKAYIRRGGRDDTCTGDELLRFIRDGATERFDAKPLDLDISRCFDEASVRWYRAQFNHANPGKDEADDNQTFLHKWGFLVEQDGKLLPTRAAILVLGSDTAFRQILPRITVDMQLYRHKADEYSPHVRWADRLSVEQNLIKAWQSAVDFYFKHSERPFSIDSTTMRRADDPPDYVSFREAAINLLIHQDFGDHTRLPVIRFFRDQAEFFNPGDALATREQLLDPGDKAVRNPSVVNAFRRIGLSDQGGTGVGAIFKGWRDLGYVPPQIENDKAEKSFRLRLSREKLVTEAQLLAQASLGAQLSEQEAAVFAYLSRQGQVDVADIKALTGLNGPAARKLAQRLAVQVLVEAVGESGSRFVLSPHLRARFQPTDSAVGHSNQIVTDDSETAGATEQVTEQVGSGSPEQGQRLVQLTEVQWKVIEYADTPRSFAQLMAHTGYRQRPFFKAQHLDPLIAGKLLRMTVPDKPRSSRQQYVLTEAGVKLKAWRTEQPATSESTNKNDHY